MKKYVFLFVVALGLPVFAQAAAPTFVQPTLETRQTITPDEELANTFIAWVKKYEARIDAIKSKADVQTFMRDMLIEGKAIDKKYGERMKAFDQKVENGDPATLKLKEKMNRAMVSFQNKLNAKGEQLKE